MLEAAGNLLINNEATVPRRQGDESPHGPPVRPVAGELKMRCGHNYTNYCLVSFCKSRAKGLEVTGNLLMM